MEQVLDIIKEYRKKRGYTQEQLGKKIGMARTSYQSIECGDNKLNVIDFFKIIDILNIPITIFSKDDLLIISKNDLLKLENYSKAISEITSKITEQNKKYSIYDNQNQNISIGNNNNIQNSFNKK